MILTSDSTARPSVSFSTNPTVVTYPAASAAHRQSAQAIVLHTLTHPSVGPVEENPLVAASLESTTTIPLRSNTKQYGKRALRLDMGNDVRSLHQAFLPAGSHFPKPHWLRQRTLYLDEGYLHLSLSAWEGKSELDKLLITASAMSAIRCVAFTVNFSEQRQKALLADLPSAFRKLRNTLAGMNNLGASMATLERDKKGRLHLHGIVVTGEPWAVVRAALRPVGGKSKNKKFDDRFQVLPKRAHSPLFWAMYMTKDLTALPTSESEGLLYMSQSARKLGRDHMSTLRTFAEQKFDMKCDLRGRAAVYTKSCKRKPSGTTAGMTH